MCMCICLSSSANQSTYPYLRCPSGYDHAVEVMCPSPLLTHLPVMSGPLTPAPGWHAHTHASWFTLAWSSLPVLWAAKDQGVLYPPVTPPHQGLSQNLNPVTRAPESWEGLHFIFRFIGTQSRSSSPALLPLLPFPEVTVDVNLVCRLSTLF